MENQTDPLQSPEPCVHSPERCITYSTNSASGCAAPTDREITTCSDCHQVVASK